MAKTKTRINFLIDILMFLCLAAMAGIGFLMKFVLIPGKDRFLVYGRNVELYFGGLDRHQWGTVHLIVAFVMLGLLALHIILHWKAVITQFKSWVGNKNLRRVLTILFVIICFLLVYIPIRIKPEMEEFEGRGRYSIQRSRQPETTEELPEHDTGQIQESSKPEEEVDKPVEEPQEEMKVEAEEHEIHDPAIEVRGFMTLKEVSLQYDVPTSYIKENLNIPATTDDNEKLGWLRRQYGITMSEVRDVIEKYRKSQNK